MTAVEAVDSATVWTRVNRRLLPPLFVVSLVCQVGRVYGTAGKLPCVLSDCFNYVQLDRSNLAFAALQMDSDLGFSRTVHGAGSGVQRGAWLSGAWIFGLLQ